MNSTTKMVIKILMLLASIGVVFLVSRIGSNTSQPVDFGFSPPTGSGAATAVDPTWSIGGLTIFGVMASLAVSALRAQPQNAPLNFGAFFGAPLYPQTFIALCVSPVVFFTALLGFDGKGFGTVGIFSCISKWILLAADTRCEKDIVFGVCATTLVRENGRPDAKATEERWLC
jgi:hypothetical protein